MQKLALQIPLFGIAAFGFFASAAYAAKPVPCEQMLTDLRTSISSAHLGDADMAKVKELEKTGIERCSADDDVHADAIFVEALKILSK